MFHLLVSEPLADALDFFYPKEMDPRKSITGKPGGRSWRGFQGLWEPCIPSRLSWKFLSVIHEALRDRDRNKILECIEFLESSHWKYMSQAGRGEEDVLCIPAESLIGASLLKKLI